MNSHKHAKTTLQSRLDLVQRVQEQGQPIATVAAAFGISERTVYKWLRRFNDEGAAGLTDRRTGPAPTGCQLGAAVLAEIETLRRQGWAGVAIAQQVRVPQSTVSRVLRQLGISRARDLQPHEPVVRYEHAAPGDMVHFDIKRLGRFCQPGHRVTGQRSGVSRHMGWEYLHVAIDDHSRFAMALVLPDQQGASAVAMLRAVVAAYAQQGHRIRSILTDNGPCYHSRAFQRACAELGIRHYFTKPYTPRTNGKAERLIRTALSEWAYAKPYATSDARTNALNAWLLYYNQHRRHAGINHQTPTSRFCNQQSLNKSVNIYN